MVKPSIFWYFWVPFPWLGKPKKIDDLMGALWNIGRWWHMAGASKNMIYIYNIYSTYIYNKIYVYITCIIYIYNINQAIYIYWFICLFILFLYTYILQRDFLTVTLFVGKYVLIAVDAGNYIANRKWDNPSLLILQGQNIWSRVVPIPRLINQVSSGKQANRCNGQRTSWMIFP